MNERRLLRRCAAAVILAALLWPLAGGLGDFVSSGQMLSLLLYVQTGRAVSVSGTEPSTAPTFNSTFPTQITQPSPVETTPEAVLSFSPDDLDLVQLRDYAGCAPALDALLTQPLELELTGEEPTVLILHTHATESYTGNFDYSDPYRSLNDAENMLAVGDAVAQALTAGGVTVIHDRTLHDYPDYNSAYSAARETVQQYLQEYPTIRIVLDLHRDATSGTGGQLVTAATVNGQRSAQLMVVAGTDAGGSACPNWRENLALALKLCVVLEQENPGITRPISLRSSRYNADLSTGSLLIEVGAAGNTLDEAITAASALAEALLKLAHGSE